MRLGLTLSSRQRAETGRAECDHAHNLRWLDAVATRDAHLGV